MGGRVHRGSQAWNTGNTRHAGSSDQVWHASPELVCATVSTKLGQGLQLEFWSSRVKGTVL